MKVFTNPTAVFVALASAFGLLLVILTPPLRGPDEPAHFLRAYGIAGGAIVPLMTDEHGRRGVLLPVRLHDDFRFFAEARASFTPGTSTYFQVFAEYRRWQADRPDEIRRADRAPVFVRYEGSEGYTPAPYLAYAAAAAVGKLFGFGFLPLLYLMRLTGLAFTIVVMAYAISRAQRLRWALLFIAMLPAALYGRSVISADSGALAFTMVITVLCLDAARTGSIGHMAERSLWMTLSVLSKPPHIVFVALEFMTRRFREMPRQWRVLTAVTAPGVILLLAWLLAISGDMAAWRMIEAMRLPSEDFDPVRKARFLIDSPLHFPALMWSTVAQDWDLLWRQLVGVLGWLDVWLRPELYSVLAFILIAVMFDKLDVSRTVRYRIAFCCFMITVGYAIAVYAIFYLTWTPIDAPTIWGVQGRYFVIILPVVAVLISAIANVRLPKRVAASLAIAGAIVAGTAAVEGVVRTEFLQAGFSAGLATDWPQTAHSLRAAAGFSEGHTS